MSSKLNNEESKLKETFLINFKSRNDEKKLKFTKWLAAQSNPQSSFLSLIEHCIDRFGYQDVTDHEIAKKLHTEILYYNNQHISEIPEKKEQVVIQKSESENIHIVEDEIENDSLIEKKNNDESKKTDKEVVTQVAADKSKLDLGSF